LIKRFISYYKPHKTMFILDMVFAFILAACDLFYPVLTGEMLDRYIPNGMINALLICAAVLFGVYIIKIFLNYFVMYYGHIVGVRMQADMRRDIFDRLQTLPLSYFDNNKTGTIMSRIINDLMDVSELAHHGPEDLFLSLVMFIGSFILMASISLPLTLIVYAAVPFMVVFAVKKRKKMSDAFTQSRVEVGEINASLENSISGIRVSKAYDNKEEESRNFVEGNKKFVTARSAAYKAMAEFHTGITFIGDFLQVVLYVCGGVFCYKGMITVGEFTSFALYISVFMNPIRKLVGFVEQYQNGMSGFERFCEIMDTAPEEETGTVDAGILKGNVEYKNVTFSYDEESGEVLSGLDLRIDAGKTVALVGPSGGGKTTICHLLPRFYEITDGEITIDGRNICEYTRSSLRRNIGIVAQDVFLFNATIYENIIYGCGDVTREMAEEAAKRANIHDYIMTLPDGYDTVVGERGVKLSGGQKQRISIARVFLKKPPILILDEATSALDNVTERMIQKSLEELCVGRTTIVVAHRLTTVMNAHEILVITDEGITERGTHEELLHAGGIYAGLWEE